MKVAYTQDINQACHGFYISCSKTILVVIPNKIMGHPPLHNGRMNISDKGTVNVYPIEYVG